jgi:DNA end-binding protein Ku
MVAQRMDDQSIGDAMAARSSWKGFLKLGLVSLPVKAYTVAASGRGEIHLNQLHAECHSRIQYMETCPIHGEVSNDQILLGFEHAKGQYVIVDSDSLRHQLVSGEEL